MVYLSYCISGGDDVVGACCAALLDESVQPQVEILCSTYKP